MWRYAWGLEAPPSDEALAALLGGVARRIHTAWFMVWSGRVPRVQCPEGFEVHGGGVEEACRVLIDAFSVHHGLPEWRLEECIEGSRGKGILVGLYRGRPVAAAVYRCLSCCDGGVALSVDLLGVVPQMQRRGIGSCMLTKLILMNPCGATRVVLNALGGVEGFYERLGFRPVRAYTAYRLHSSTLLEALGVGAPPR